MAVGTALSRATGLGRTVALASALGVTAVADAYNTANTAPLMLYTLVAGGVLTSGVVPLLVKSGDGESRREAASALLGFVVLVGAALSVVTALAAPWIMRVLTLGAAGRGDYTEFVDLGTRWLRMFSPQVGAYALSVLAVGIMTARGRLALGAFAPVVTNVVTAAAAVAFVAISTGLVAPGAIDDGAVAVLGWGTTGGVLAMAFIQAWGARRAEPGLRFAIRPRHPVVAQLVRLGGWMLLYVGVNQAGLAVVVAMANSVPGGVTAYQWAFMLMQLPYAVIAVSLYSAALPRIASATAAGRDVSAAAGPPGRISLALVVPAAAGLALLAGPVAAAVVGPTGAPLLAAALVGFAVSLAPFTVFQLLTRVCYARQDTRTPALVNVVVNAVNLAVDAAVLFAISDSEARIAGFALGHAASYVAGCLALGADLRRRGVLTPSALVRGLGRVAAATAAMALALAWVPARVGIPGSRATACLVAVALAAGGAVIYVGVASVTGVPRALGVSGSILKRRARSADNSDDERSAP